MRSRKTCLCYLLLFFLFTLAGPSAETAATQPEPHAPPLSPLQEALVQAAHELMNSWDISYIYGGHSIKSGDYCQQCTQCLQRFRSSHEKLARCPACRSCSLDCSHYTQRVFEWAGLKAPYLATTTMLASSPQTLVKTYHLVPIPKLELASTGDLLVYRGHVAMLLTMQAAGRGDIIHATSGRDIRLPGQGVQKETNVALASFRGPLLRILRHEALTQENPPLAAPSALPPIKAQGLRKLRPVAKQYKSPD